MKVALPKSLAKYAHAISDVSDERSSGDGYWVYLKNGWKSGSDTLGCVHQIHEDTPTECASEMKSILRCDCRDCKEVL